MAPKIKSNSFLGLIPDKKDKQVAAIDEFLVSVDSLRNLRERAQAGNLRLSKENTDGLNRIEDLADKVSLFREKLFQPTETERKQERFADLSEKFAQQEPETEFKEGGDFVKSLFTGESLTKDRRDESIQPLPARGILPQEMRAAEAREFQQLQQELPELEDDAGDLFTRAKKIGTTLASSALRGLPELANILKQGQEIRSGQAIANKLFGIDSKPALPDNVNEFFERQAENIALRAAGVRELPKTGKFAKPIEGVRDFFDPERLVVASVENSIQMAGFIAATAVNPVAGLALMASVEGGSALQGIDDFEKRTGQKVSDDDKLAIFTIVGGINGALEQVPIKGLLDLIKSGGGKRLLSAIMTSMSESATEGLQEINSVVTQKGFTKEPITNDDWQNFIVAAQAGMGMGMTSAAVGTITGAMVDRIARKHLGKEPEVDINKPDIEFSEGVDIERTPKQILGQFLDEKKRRLPAPSAEGGRKAIRLPAKEQPGTVIGNKKPVTESDKESIQSDSPTLPEIVSKEDNRLDIEDLRASAGLLPSFDDFTQALDEFQFDPEQADRIVREQGFESLEDFHQQASSGTLQPFTPEQFAEAQDARKEQIDAQTQGDPNLDSVLESGIKLRDSDRNDKGKLREEISALQKRFGPGIINTDDTGQTLDEHASNLGITEEELRQSLLKHESPAKRKRKAPKPTPVKHGKPQENLDLGDERTIPKGKIKTEVVEPEEGTLFAPEKPDVKQTDIEDAETDIAQMSDGDIKKERISLERKFKQNNGLNGDDADRLGRLIREEHSRKSETEDEERDISDSPEADSGDSGIQSVRDAIQTIVQSGQKLDNPKLSKAVRDAAPEFNESGINDQFEFVQVGQARKIIGEHDRTVESGRITLANKLKNLYNKQPNLNRKTSTKLNQQQFSTPIPLAYMMGESIGITGSDKVLDTTAGNGALLITAKKENITANELDANRAQNLRDSGVSNVLEQDATEDVNVEDKSQDVVIINPPFRMLKGGAQSVSGVKLKKLEHVIALKALDKMADNGRAAILMGGHSFKDILGRPLDRLSEADKRFFNHVYSKYNVTGHFNIGKRLYSRQGTSFPTRLIFINGRQESNNFAPRSSEEVTSLDTWSQVFEAMNERLRDNDILRSQRNTGRSTPVRPGSPDAQTGKAQQGDVQEGIPEETGRTSEQGDTGRHSVTGRPTKPAGEVSKQDKSRGSGGKSDGGGRDTRDSGESGTKQPQPTPAGQSEKGVSGSIPASTFRPSLKGIKNTLTNIYGESAKKNKIVTIDRAEELQQKMRDKLNQLNSGVDPEFLAIGIELSAFHIEAGARTFVEFSKVMIETLGPKIRPYLKSFYLGARAFPGMDPEGTNSEQEIDEMLRTGDFKRVVDAAENSAKVKAEKEKVEPKKQPELFDLEEPSNPAPEPQTINPIEHPEYNEAQTFGQKDIPSYVQSRGSTLDTIMPANIVNSVRRALQNLEKAVGTTVDNFVAKELGFKTVDSLYKKEDGSPRFAGEQIDDMALAIHQMKSNSGMVIGDQTGIGKGRVAAGLTVWAIKQGKKPVFVTYKATLFTDFYRDLQDIGFGALNPFIFNAKGDKKTDPTIYNQDGKVLFKPLPQNKRGPALKDVAKDGQNCACMKDKDFAILTFSQINRTGSVQQRALAKLSENNFVIMDESHNAAGNSNTGAFVKEQTVRPSAGITYLSATYAKRPDNMPVYSKTVLGNFNDEQLTTAFTSGGVPLQEIAAAALAEAGQYIRHERSWADVDYRVVTLKDDGNTSVRVIADNITEVLRDIKRLDPIIQDAIEEINENLAETGPQEAIGQQTISQQAIGSLFASKVHNLVAQMLLSLKAERVGDMAIEAISQGKKPIIALTNTMEAVLDDTIAHSGVTDGGIIDIDFRAVVERSLSRQLSYRVDDGFGNTVERKPIDLDRFPVLKGAVESVREKINRMFSGLSGSPIDTIRQRIEDAGFKVGELTGRNNQIDFSDKDNPKLQRRTQVDKNEILRMFNGNTTAGRSSGKGEIDAVIANRSVSTGISAHSSSDFGDQRQRVMIMAQPDLDINQVMQMFGRIFRTGQVHPPIYQVVQLDIPTEIRPAAVLSSKMASLNANVSADQDSATSLNVVNFFNEIGDEIAHRMIQAMSAKRQQTLFDRSWDIRDAESRRDLKSRSTQQLSGWLQLAPVEAQQEFMDELASEYTVEIERLDALGQNPLVSQNLNLRSTTLEKELQFSGSNQSSPLLSDGYLETLEVDVLKKSATREFVQSEIRGKENLLQDHVESVMTEGQAYFDTQIEPNVKNAETLERRIQERDRNLEFFRSVRDNLQIGLSGELTVAFGENDFGAYTAVLTGIKTEQSGNPLARSKTVATFITNDPLLQRFNVPMSQLTMGRVQSKFEFRPDTMGVPDNWEENNNNLARETVSAYTGNLFSFYMRKRSGKRKSTIARFTTHDNKVREGVLIKEGDISALSSTGTIISQNFSLAVEYINQTTYDINPQEDGKIEFGRRNNVLELRIPSTRAKDYAKIYSNPRVLELIEGREFVEGNYMQESRWKKGFIGRVPVQNEKKFIELMSKEFGYSFELPRHIIDNARKQEEPESATGEASEQPASVQFSAGFMPIPTNFKDILDGPSIKKLKEAWNTSMQWFDAFPTDQFQVSRSERAGLRNAGHEYARQMKEIFDRKLNIDLFGIESETRSSLSKAQKRKRDIFTTALTFKMEVKPDTESSRDLPTLGDGRRGEKSSFTGNTLPEMIEFARRARRHCKSTSQCEILDGAIRMLVKNEPLLDKWQRVLKRDIDSDRGLLKATGMLDTFYENYINHIWERDDTDRVSSIGLERTQGLETRNVNTQRRTIPSFLQGMATGLQPTTLNPFELNEIRKKHLVNTLANRSFLDSLSMMTIDGLPVLAKAKEVTEMGAREQYTRVPDHPALRYYRVVRSGRKTKVKTGNPFGTKVGIDAVIVEKETTDRVVLVQDNLLVHKGIAKQFIKLYQGSKLRDLGASMRFLMRVNSFYKRSKLSMSLFHHVALGQNNAFLGAAKGPGNPFWVDIGDFKSVHKTGLKQLREFNPVLFFLVKQGLTLNEMGSRADYHRLSQGLQDAWKKKIDSRDNVWVTIKNNIGDFVEWWDHKLWNRYYAGSKAMAGLAQYQANLKRMRNEFPDEYSEWVAMGNPIDGSTTYESIVSRMTARDINDLYGGLATDILGISETAMDTLRLALLAPDWQTSNWRFTINSIRGALPRASREYLIKTGSETRKVKTGARARTNRRLAAKELGRATGNLGKAAFKKYLQAYFVMGLFTQITNYAMTGFLLDDEEPRFAFQNAPGNKNKLLIYVDKDGREFYLDTLRHFGEPLKIFKRFKVTDSVTDSALSLVSSIAKYLEDKRSAVINIAKEIVTMRDWRDRPFSDLDTLLKTGEHVTSPTARIPRHMSRIPGLVVQQVHNVLPIPAEEGFQAATGKKSIVQVGGAFGGMHITTQSTTPEVREMLNRLGVLIYKSQVGTMTKREAVEMRVIKARLRAIQPEKEAEKKAKRKIKRVTRPDS